MSGAASDLGDLDPRDLLKRGLEPAPVISSWEPPSAEEIGKLLPRYRIERLLGRGGMGAVYQAVQPDLDRPVAIKVLPAGAAENEAFVARFQREARILARLRHPGIVAIYDFGRTIDGLMYFAMEYVDGSDLNAVIQGPGVDVRRALEIIQEVCAALQCAHAVGVVHRDIKPANILITRDGHAKLADFGVALPPAGQEASLTLTHAVVGSDSYMAPEQRHGGECDQRADIFSVGVVLYELLTGRVPRGAFHLPSRKVDVDLRVDGIVLKALQEDLNRRYQRVSDLQTDLERIRLRPLPAIDPVLAPVEEPAPASTTPGQRMAAVLSVMAWMAPGAVLCAFFIWHFFGRQGMPDSAAIFKTVTGILNVNATPPPTSSTTVAPTPLVQALLANEWSWRVADRGSSGGSLPGVYTFDADGKVHCSATSGSAEWRATGPRSFIILNRGWDIGLGWISVEFSFNANLTQCSGVRPGDGQTLGGSILQRRPEASAETASSPASSATPTPAFMRTNPKTLDEALASWTWIWTDSLPRAPKPVVQFKTDGTLYNDWRWSKIDERKLRVRFRSDISVDLTFDETFSRFSGSYFDDVLRSHIISGTRGSPVVTFPSRK